MSNNKCRIKRYYYPFAVLAAVGVATACARAGATPAAEAATPPSSVAPAEPASAEPAANVEASSEAAPSDVKRDEEMAYEQAKPIFEAYCAKCHTSQGGKSAKGALSHFNMDGYPFGGHHSEEIGSVIREVLGVNGAKPTMPRDKPGSVQGEDLRLILTWADAYDRAHARGAPASGHEHDEH